MSRIAIMGSGGWGSAMGIMLSGRGMDVTLWSKFEKEIENLEKTRENPLLKNVRFPDELKLTSDPACAADADMVITAVPSFAVRSTMQIIKPYISRQTVVNIAKGLEEPTLKRLSEVIGEELQPERFAVLSGPSHAEEVSRGIPTTVVAASDDHEVAEYVQDMLMSPRFRVYTSSDMVGVELGGALKNVVAICAGICDGMQFGDNTKAALMTRGITEIARLGVAMGGRPETFAGLSGIGDLIVTCTSVHSRNHRAGELIGRGVPVQEALKQVNMVVEGYVTSKAAYELARRVGVDMPIITEAYRILYEGKDHTEAINDLMTRSKKMESEQSWVGDML